ncbi:MAG: hypothetical protein JW750_02340 [Anaerolineaceae bacterium]|nr:hypothetical protein [Anaerolineaceae bacterium]
MFQTHSSYWYEAAPRVLQAFPFHRLIRPTEKELHSLIFDHGIVALRYSTPLDAPPGCVSYHAYYDQPRYLLEDLERRTRQNVNRGLRNCKVERISIDRMAEEGWYLENDTADRQNRENIYAKDEWYRRYHSAADLPGFEVYGALIDGKLVAGILAFQMGDCCELISQQCDRNYLNDRVNHALTYTIVHEMMERPQINSVFYSLQSLDAPPSVDEFKFRMNFSARPVRQRVIFHPYLQFAINPLTYGLVRWMSQIRPENSRLAKAEGMLRFYLNGKHPLETQDWPEPLAQVKMNQLHFKEL